MGETKLDSGEVAAFWKRTKYLAKRNQKKAERAAKGKWGLASERIAKLEQALIVERERKAQLCQVKHFPEENVSALSLELSALRTMVGRLEGKAASLEKAAMELRTKEAQK